MWDAAEGEYYWKGVANPPTTFGSLVTGYPSVSTDSRWYNTPVPGANVLANSASRSCKNLPTFCAMTWYVMRGDPRWDEYYPWCLNGDYAHIYNKGAWFLKWNEIPNKPAGTTQTTCDIAFGHPSAPTKMVNCMNPTTDYQTKGRPAPGEIDKYFFLPALGMFDNGKHSIEFGINGAYWSSSGGANSWSAALIINSNHTAAFFYYYSKIINGQVFEEPRQILGYYGLVVAPDWFQ